MVVFAWTYYAFGEQQQVSRRFCRNLLCHYLGEAVADSLYRDEKGRPRLPVPDTDLSVSHAGGIVAVALALPEGTVLPDPPEGIPVTVLPDILPPVGLDLECAAGKSADTCLRVAQRWFFPDEVTFLRGLSACDVPAAFCRIWTGKESYCKLTGNGLADLRKIDTLAPPDSIRFFSVTLPLRAHISVTLCTFRS